MPVVHSAHERPESYRALSIALALTAGWFIVEVIGGIFTHSLALLADAGHMLSDVGALGLALFALWYSRRQATSRRSYGYYRGEFLAALFNGLALFVISLYVIVEAVRRMQNIQEINGGLMLVIAVIGLGVNIAAAWVLSRTHDKSLNVRAAFLHVVGDALGSVGVIAAGTIMVFTGWYLADPIVGIFIAVLIVFAAIRLLRHTIDVLLEGVPQHIDLLKVRDAIAGFGGIKEVHDLHIWTLATGCVAMSVHARTSLDGGWTVSSILIGLRTTMKQQFGIDHLTVQLEADDLPDEQVHVSGDPRCLA